MRTVGSRELKLKLGAILREVRENRASYVVTQHGRPVARIVPEADANVESAEFQRIWSELDRLSEEVGREWPVGTEAADAVCEDRREL